jgi:hypothetical protein
MRYQKYDNVITSSDKLEFQFDSDGPKGKIKKVVQFAQTQNENIYNLAFGNLNKDGSVDDETTNDNKDRNKILATVAELFMNSQRITRIKPFSFVAQQPKEQGFTVWR